MPFSTTDTLIRHAIRASLEAAHRGEDAVIVDELKVALGSGRMDVAVINGRLEGYEIKSDKDSLIRLPKQVSMFGAVAERMTLVTGYRHLDKALEVVPDWWSVVGCECGSDNRLSLKRLRRGRLNRKLDKTALLETLERDEIVQLLASAQLDKGYRGATYRALADRAIGNISIERISNYVKMVLKLRARFAHRYGDLAFGRSVIVCGESSARDAGLHARSTTAMDV